MLRTLIQPLTFTCTPQFRKIKRSFQTQRAEKSNLSVYFTSTQSCCSAAAFSQHIPATPNSQFNLLVSLGDKCTSSWVHPCQYARVSTDTPDSLTHSQRRGSRSKVQTFLPCHIPAVSNSSRGGGHTMDTLYLAQASGPTKVNPAVTACRTWGVAGSRNNETA